MEKKIVVKAGFHQRNFCPVSCVIEENLKNAKPLWLFHINLPCSGKQKIS